MLVKVGDRGLEVVDVQLRLRKVGLFKGNISGHCGKELDEAIKMYQATARIIVDGVVGPQTFGRLMKETQNYWGILYLHCSASPAGLNLSGKRISDYHTKHKKWSRPGYSDVIELDGKLTNIRPFDSDNMIGEWEYSFGVKGSTMLNRNARHLCYVGGVDADDNEEAEDTRTPEQLVTMETYIKFMLLRNPLLVIAGHNQVQPKACPSFDVPTYLKSIGVPIWNIAMWGKHYE